MQLLESRLDHVVYIMGMAVSRKQARQYTRHGFVKVNGRRVTIPSYQVREGDAVQVVVSDQMKNFVKENIEVSRTRPVPGWLEVNTDDLSAKVVRLPSRDEFPYEVNEQLIIEFCSR